MHATHRLIHELNNVFSAIRCNAFVIQTGRHVNDDLLEAARDISVAVQRGAELVSHVAAVVSNPADAATRSWSGNGAGESAIVPDGALIGPSLPAQAERSVLVVDDDPVVHRAVTRFLASRGYRIVSAKTPQEALAHAAQHQIGVVITDLIMPGMTGYDLALRIRKIRADVRFIYMSGYAPKGFAASNGSEQAAAGPILQKPFPVEALMRLLSAAFGEGTTQSEQPTARTASTSNQP
jgi:CheY-like chemotaxis protein